MFTGQRVSPHSCYLRPPVAGLFGTIPGGLMILILWPVTLPHWGQNFHEGEIFAPQLLHTELGYSANRASFIRMVKRSVGATIIPVVSGMSFKSASWAMVCRTREAGALIMVPEKVSSLETRLSRRMFIPDWAEMGERASAMEIWRSGGESR